MMYGLAADTNREAGGKRKAKRICAGERGHLLVDHPARPDAEFVFDVNLAVDQRSMLLRTGDVICRNGSDLLVVPPTISDVNFQQKNESVLLAREKNVSSNQVRTALSRPNRYVAM